MMQKKRVLYIVFCLERAVRLCPTTALLCLYRSLAVFLSTCFVGSLTSLCCNPSWMYCFRLQFFLSSVLILPVLFSVLSCLRWSCLCGPFFRPSASSVVPFLSWCAILALGSLPLCPSLFSPPWFFLCASFSRLWSSFASFLAPLWFFPLCAVFAFFRFSLVRSFRLLGFPVYVALSFLVLPLCRSRFFGPSWCAVFAFLVLSACVVRAFLVLCVLAFLGLSWFALFASLVCRSRLFWSFLRVLFRFFGLSLVWCFNCSFLVFVSFAPLCLSSCAAAAAAACFRCLFF